MEIKLGECYNNVLIYLEAQDNKDDWTVVHGIVTGQAEIEGVQHGHAWLEKTVDLFGHSFEMVVDPSAKVEFPKDYYYQLGKITHTARYTYQEVLDLIDETVRPGPWDEKIMRAKHNED